MLFSTYKKLRIVFFHRKGLKAPEIGKRLFEEGMMTSRQGIHRFIKRFGTTSSISRSGQLSKVMEVIIKALNKNHPSLSTSAWLDILR